ncbi:P7 [Firespike leaf roll-associated virus]|nr:P7 [Firespike leaf roll-associated virus]
MGEICMDIGWFFTLIVIMVCINILVVTYNVYVCFLATEGQSETEIVRELSRGNTPVHPRT